MNEDKDRKPTHAEIAQLAYELYCLRGDAPGCPEEDWIRAEESLGKKSDKDESE